MMIAVLRRFSYQGNAGHTFAADNRGEIQKMAICYCHTQVQAMAIRNSLPTDLNLTNAPNSRIYYAPWLEDLKQLWNSTWFRTLGSLDVLRCSFHKSRPARIAWWKCNDTSSHHTPPDGFYSMRGFGTPPSFKVFLHLHVLKCSHLTFDVWNPFDHILRSLGKSCLGSSLQTACRLQWSRLRLKKYLYRADFGRLWPMATWPFLPRCLACWSRVEWFVSSLAKSQYLAVTRGNRHEWTWWHLRRTGSLVKWKFASREYFYGLVGDELRIARGGRVASDTTETPWTRAVLRSPFHHSIVYPSISGWNFCMHPDRHVVPWRDERHVGRADSVQMKSEPVNHHGQTYAWCVMLGRPVWCEAVELVPINAANGFKEHYRSRHRVFGFEVYNIQKQCAFHPFPVCKHPCRPLQVSFGVLFEMLLPNPFLVVSQQHLRTEN